MRGNLKLGNTRGKEERPSLFIVRSSQLSDQFLRFQHMVLKINFRMMKGVFQNFSMQSTAYEGNFFEAWRDWDVGGWREIG